MSLLRQKSLSGKEGNAWRSAFLLMFLWCMAGCENNFHEEFNITTENDLITKGIVSEDSAIVTAVTIRKSISFDVKRDGDIVVDWGDGTQGNNVFRHDYTDNGPHTIKFYGSKMALTYFFGINSGLTALDITRCAALDTLICGENQLGTIDVSQNRELRHLVVAGNQLTELNVTNNTNLDMLICFNNQLTILDVSSLLNLRHFDCSDNNLTNLNLNNNTMLTNLYCGNNQLVSLELQKQSNLETLYCPGNQLASLNVAINVKIESITCYDNNFLYDTLELLSFANSLPNKTEFEPGHVTVLRYDESPDIANTIRSIAEAKNWYVN